MSKIYDEDIATVIKTTSTTLSGTTYIWNAPEIGDGPYLHRLFNPNKNRYEYTVQLDKDYSFRFINEDDNQAILIGGIEIPLKVLERVAKEIKEETKED